MAASATAPPAVPIPQDIVRAKGALQALNFLMAGMHAGVEPFLGTRLRPDKNGRRW